MNNPVQSTQLQIAKYNLERQLKSSASWFYWIAALSLINWIATAFNIGFSFVIGLGATQLIDAIKNQLIQQLGSGTAMILNLISLLGCLAIAGIYAIFGYFGSQRAVWAFVIGSILYVLDALLFLWFGDYLALIFHGWALIWLVRGPGIIKKLRAYDEPQPIGLNIQPLS